LIFSLLASLILHGIIFYFFMTLNQVHTHPNLKTTSISLIQKNKTSAPTQATSVRSELDHADTNSLGTLSGVRSETPSEESEGSEVSEGNLKATLQQLENQILKFLEYPQSLRRRKIQGQVHIQLSLDSQGQIKFIQIVKRSSSPELDQLAYTAVLRAAPFDVGQNQILIIPIEFKIVR
jgi:TonB family protein